MAKLIKDLSDEELLKEFLYWHNEIKNTPSWGAALAAASEFRTACHRQILLRGLDLPIIVGDTKFYD